MELDFWGLFLNFTKGSQVGRAKKKTAGFVPAVFLRFVKDAGGPYLPQTKGAAQGARAER